jgi:hypothetical protein
MGYGEKEEGPFGEQRTFYGHVVCTFARRRAWLGCPSRVRYFHHGPTGNP